MRTKTTELSPEVAHFLMALFGFDAGEDLRGPSRDEVVGDYPGALRTRETLACAST